MVQAAFDSHLANSREPEAIPTRSDIAKLPGDLGEMLLSDLAKEIKEKLTIKASSTRSRINLKLSSTRPEIHHVQPTFGLRDCWHFLAQSLEMG